jgi:hypothetical protein
MKFGICSPPGFATEVAGAGFDFVEWPLRDAVGETDAETPGMSQKDGPGMRRSNSPTKLAEGRTR